MLVSRKTRDYPGKYFELGPSPDDQMLLKYSSTKDGKGYRSYLHLDAGQFRVTLSNSEFVRLRNFFMATQARSTANK